MYVYFIFNNKNKQKIKFSTDERISISKIVDEAQERHCWVQNEVELSSTTK